MSLLRAFDFNAQVKKFNQVVENKISTFITAEKFFNAVYSIALKNPNAKFEIVSLESDFIKFGSDITMALTKAGVEYSVFLIDTDDVNFEKPEEVFAIKNCEIIVLGGKDFISYARFYASNTNGGCHALLTEPYVEGLLGNKVTVPDGGFFKSITVSPLKTLVLDKDVISKARGNKIAYAYIKSIGKLIALIEYKLSILCGAKQMDKVHYDRARLLVTLLSQINTFKKPIEIIVYCSLTASQILASSNVLSCAGNEKIAHAIELINKDFIKCDVAMTAFIKTAKLYHAFFTNDLTDLPSVADYNGDISLLCKISGKDKEYFYSLLKIPSKERKKLLAKLINLTRADFLKETSVIISMLDGVQKTFLALKKTNESLSTIKYPIVKESLKLAPYLTSEVTVLSLCRDFGVINLAK